MENVLVADVMTRNPITISPDKSLYDATKIMIRKRVGSLPIIDKKKLVGIITKKDVLWALLKKPRAELAEIKVMDISPRKLAVIKPSATMKEAFEKMKKTKFEKLPVVLDKELVGFITARDILMYSPEVYPELEEFAKIQEEKEKLMRVRKARERKSLYEGLCEECGEMSPLYKLNGILMCENCRSAM
jgi:CBS domain-containing protein